MTDVVTTVEGALGRITLDRPKAINALTRPMVGAIAAALTEWATLDRVSVVVLDGAGERGFCAGGDLVMMRRSALDGDDAAQAFWRDEYRLNAQIAAYPKPVVVLMDGIVMGGGVGLSGHARHRVATERLIWAMPEVGIGFTPDVGGTLLLAWAPGNVGVHVALTAARVGAGDAIACGFADSFVASEQLGRLLEDLRDGEPAAAIAAATARSGPRPPAVLMADRARIDACYAADSAEIIAARLEAEGLSTAFDGLRAGSPTSVKVTLAAIRRAAALDALVPCLRAEYRTASGIMGTPDFVEGIRAMVIDKDRRPAWAPDRLEAVSDAAVEQILDGPAGLTELDLARPAA